jgi:hypothetical protein
MAGPANQPSKNGLPAKSTEDIDEEKVQLAMMVRVGLLHRSSFFPLLLLLFAPFFSLAEVEVHARGNDKLLTLSRMTWALRVLRIYLWRTNLASAAMLIAITVPFPEGKASPVALLVELVGASTRCGKVREYLSPYGDPIC